MKKMKIFKKTLALLLALTLTSASLAGCGAGEGSGADSAKNADSTKTTVNADSDAFKFDSPKDVVFPLKEKLTLKVFVNNPDQSVTSYQDTWVNDWIEEQTNIHLDYVYDLTGD